MQKLEKLVDQLDIFARLIGYEINNPPKKRPFPLKIFVWLSIINLVVAIAELVGFIYYVRDDLMKILIQVQVIMLDVEVSITAYSLYSFHEKFIFSMEWCRARNKTALMHPVERRICRSYMDSANKYARYVLHFGGTAIWFAFTSVIILKTFTGFWLQHLQYSLPLPFIMPYLPPTNWWTYAINWLHQGWAGETVCATYTVLLGVTFMPAIYFFAYQSATVEVIQNMKPLIDSQEMNFVEWLRLVNGMVTENKL